MKILNGSAKFAFPRSGHTIQYNTNAMKSLYQLSLFLFILAFSPACKPVNRQGSPGNLNYIRVSQMNPTYFEFADGTPYIPVGINLINPSSRFRNNPDSSLSEVIGWMRNLSENGGNYVRIWLSESFWDVEDQQAGVYSEAKAARIDSFFAAARKYNLRVKITLEHFRSLTMEENPQSWAMKAVYHRSHGGPLDSIRQYLTAPEGQRLFLDKIDYYKKRYGSDTLFFGWELWNEMNAMHVPMDSVFFAWNEKMLAEVKQRFPRNLVMQSFGSFDDEGIRPYYQKLMHMPGNEVAQIHRYLDPGAPMEICQKPMDIICSSAVGELRSYKPGKPLLLAETGAVEWQHSGPSKLYPKDTAGILLHDILFAPFFSGAAGTGMSWHWDSYVDRNHLWYHFRRFSEAVKGLNPAEEDFRPSLTETGDLRIYWLTGKHTVMVWIRDSRDTWKTELVEEKPPRTIQGIGIDPEESGITGKFENISIYDPWKDRWTQSGSDGPGVILPDFKRSLVVRMTRTK